MYVCVCLYICIYIYIYSILSYFQHMSGLDEAVMRNIDACKQLANTTKSAYGPYGNYLAQLIYFCMISVINLLRDFNDDY